MKNNRIGTLVLMGASCVVAMAAVAGLTEGPVNPCATN